MNSADIRFAAELLKKREELAALRSSLRTKPSLRLGLYAMKSEEDGTMHDAMSVSNELGAGLIDIAMKANTDALAELGVAEFTEDAGS